MRKQPKEIEFEFLNSVEFPRTKIYNQIVRLHRPSGGINVGTWKYCTKLAQAQAKNQDWTKIKQPYNSDFFFDDYIDHVTYVIKEFGTDHVLAWALITIGKFNGKRSKAASIQFFSRPNIRGLGLGSKLFKEAIVIAKEQNIKTLFTYNCNSNKWFFKKMQKYVPKKIKVCNVYTNIKDYVGKGKAKAA